MQVSGSAGRGSLAALARVSRLPGTAAEAAALKPNLSRYAGAEPSVFAGEYALEGVFKALCRPRVLVLSTHGFFLPDQELAHDDEQTGPSVDDIRANHAALTPGGKPIENPLLRCGLLLAGCNRRAKEQVLAEVDDGILTGCEIVGTDLRGTDLVVLNGPDAGIGQISNADAAMRLRQAFQLAGARATIATYWKTSDAETTQFLEAFFAKLAGGASPADALRNVQLALIQAHRTRRGAAHPYYWAGFALTGE
jgi:CHAT domain-containing protein